MYKKEAGMSHVGHWPSACSVETIRTIGTKKPTTHRRRGCRRCRCGSTGRGCCVCICLVSCLCVVVGERHGWMVKSGQRLGLGRSIHPLPIRVYNTAYIYTHYTVQYSNHVLCRCVCKGAPEDEDEDAEVDDEEEGEGHGRVPVLWLL